MRYSLLQMVQRILESMDSDEVNSYSDTVESTAVANIIKESYYNIVGRLDLPANHTFFQLNASGDNTKPVLMTLPNDALNLDYIKYKLIDGSSTSWKDINYLPLEEFILRNLDLNEAETNISTMLVSCDGVNFQFKYYNDRSPTHYTTIDNTTILFDSFELDVENTLQSSKTMCYGAKIPVFTMNDNFVPQLDANQFQLLINEAKSQAFIELKQTQNTHSDMRARKAFINTQRTKENLPSNKTGLSKVKRFGKASA